MRPINFSDIIIFENQNFIVVNKPPFLSSLQDRNDPDNLLALSKKYISEAQLCHRLDKETSGALIIAKHPDAYRWMTQQLQNRKVNKVYHALVNGTHRFNEQSVEVPLRKMGNGQVKVDFKAGKESTTIVTSLHHYKTSTLLSCQLITGRMHQIRVHLSYLSAPIVSDASYGGEPIFLSDLKTNFRSGRDKEEKPLIQRLALHANEIKFVDLDGKAYHIAADYPKDFKVLLKQLKKYGSPI